MIGAVAGGRVWDSLEGPIISSPAVLFCFACFCSWSNGTVYSLIHARLVRAWASPFVLFTDVIVCVLLYVYVCCVSTKYVMCYCCLFSRWIGPPLFGIGMSGQQCGM